MVGFVTYDLIFLALFIIAVIIFLKVKKKNVRRQGLVYLYKTNWGIKLMDSFSRKNKSWLFPLQYLIIASGIILMVGITWLIAESVYLYLKFPITSVTKAPPLAPLIPYFPKLFGLQSFFPPLYFTYFIIAVAIGGILHEFSHGIFARLNKFKVKSTGFLFLGPLLGAFVEPDEKQMAKAKKKSQLSILAAGTFANVIISIFFGILLVIFFSAFFAPAGVSFNVYPSFVAETNSVSVPANFSLEQDFVEVEFEGTNYLVTPQVLQKTFDENITRIILFVDAPAVRNQLPTSPSAITEFNGEKIINLQALSEEIKKYSPGDKITITMALREGLFDTQPEFQEYEIELGEFEGQAFLGIGINEQEQNKFSIRGFFNYIFEGAGTLDFLTYYESSIGKFGWFVYFLLWWVFFINVLLALFNMLPVGPLDGGRFFQLGVAGLLKNDNIGKKAFRFVTWIIALALITMMVKWAVSFF